MSLDRSFGLGMGFVVSAMLTALSLAQAGFGLFQSGTRTGRLPPHRDPRTVTKYTDADLKERRQIGDPTADKVISEIVESKAGDAGAQLALVQEIYDTLRECKHFDIADFEGKSYKDKLLAWSQTIALQDPDMAALNRAARFFKRHLFKIMVILSTSALLEAYACAKGVRVLAATEYLSNDTNRRLKETIQFVMYVSAPDAFDNGKGGKGLDAIRKIRLMHAAIRWMVPVKAGAQWRAEWGKPINVEDLLGMLMGFSCVVIRDLPKVGATLSSEEAADHIALWNEIGLLLGAPKDLLPADLGESLALMGTIKSRQQGYSDAGKKMTTALLAYHAAILGDFFDVGTGAMRRFAGDYICDMLGVPASDYAGQSPMRDYVFRTLLWWGDKLVTFKELDAKDEVGVVHSYRGYDIPKSLWSVVFPLNDA